MPRARDYDRFHNKYKLGRLMMRGLVHVVLAMALAPLAATLARAQEDPSVHMVTYIEVAPAAQG